jgi:acyl-CoA synthetase (AMP-forming)/AMP-acid ligase II
MDGAFVDRLRSFGSRSAVVFDDTTHSYDQLLELVDRWRARFDVLGIDASTVVALESAYSPDACAAVLALIERDAILVPLTDPPAAKRPGFHDIAQVEVVVTHIGSTTAARTTAAGTRGPVSARPGTPRWRIDRTGRRADHMLYRRLRKAGAPGLVLFSSGTTGAPKATVLDVTRMLARYGPPKRGQRILTFLNLDHIGGVNTLFHTLSQGGTVVTVGDRSPESVFAAIAAHRVEVLPTTPTFLNMALISGAHERHDTSSLGLVTYGTEPMPPQTLRRITAALPDVRFKQTYGLSELGILPTRSRDDRSLWLELGRAGFDHKIVDGVLWIRSEMAMLGYLNAPAPFDDEGYFNTRDKVEVDGDYVRIVGRDSEIINVGGEKVHPVEVENVLLEVPGVADATVSGRPSPVTGMVVHATVHPVGPAGPEDEKELRRRVRDFCKGRLEPFKVPALVEVSYDRLHSDRFKKVRVAS